MASAYSLPVSATALLLAIRLRPRAQPLYHAQICDISVLNAYILSVHIYRRMIRSRLIRRHDFVWLGTFDFAFSPRLEMALTVSIELALALGGLFTLMPFYHFSVVIDLPCLFASGTDLVSVPVAHVHT